MNTILITGTRIVAIALIFYSFGYFISLRKKSITNLVLLFQTLGLVTDITATILMIIGSPNSPFTIHGFIGYSSLTAMILDTFLFWRFRLISGNLMITRSLKVYSTIAYIWWILAFITGGLIVLLK